MILGCKVTKKRVQNKKNSFFFYAECIVSSMVCHQSYNFSDYYTQN